MFPTVEVRWFYDGMIPGDVLTWFQQGEGASKKPSSRVDYYLCLSDRDSLGIKLREGKIEVKQRQQQYGLIRLHEHVAGQMEQWHKWSFALADETESVVSDIKVSPSSWIAVEKARQQWEYYIASNKQIRARSTKAALKQGCNLELTTVSIEGAKWWTLGFEAYGDRATNQENLLLVIEYVFAGREPPVLDAKDSFGYPQWLNHLYSIPD
jgi:hypothetical protein